MNLKKTDFWGKMSKNVSHLNNLNFKLNLEKNSFRKFDEIPHDFIIIFYEILCHFRQYLECFWR